MAHGALQARHCFLSRLFGLVLLIFERFFFFFCFWELLHGFVRMRVKKSSFNFLSPLFDFSHSHWSKFMRRLVWQFLGISTRSIWSGWLHIFMVVGIACILFRCWRATTPHALSCMCLRSPTLVCRAIAARIPQSHRRRQASPALSTHCQKKKNKKKQRNMATVGFMCTPLRLCVSACSFHL